MIFVIILTTWVACVHVMVLRLFDKVEDLEDKVEDLEDEVKKLKKKIT